MFNAKRKEAEKQARLQEYAAAEKKFTQAVAATQDIADPAERILKLSEISKEITQYCHNAHQTAMKRRNDLGLTALMGAAPGAVLMIGSAVLIPHVAVPVILATGGAAIAGEVGLPLWRVTQDDRRIRQRRAEVEAYLAGVTGLTGRIAKTQEKLIKEQTDQICQSPKYEELLSRLPDLSEQFKGAAAKRFTKLEEEKTAPQAKQKTGGKKPAPHNYPDFGRVFDTK